MARAREIPVTLTGHRRALLAEAAGTFWFLTIGAGAMIADVMTGGRIGIVGVALANGAAVAIAIASFRAISGAHFNPAVTLALWMTGRHPRDRVHTYWGAQAAGAVAAGILLRIAFDHASAAADATKLGTPAVAAGLPLLTAIALELVLTVFLVWAIMGPDVPRRAPRGTSLRVGLAVTAGTLMALPLTGAAMNPARWLGPAVAAGSFENWFVYLIGPFAGGALAARSCSLFARDAERGATARFAAPAPASAPDRTERI